MAFHWHGDTFDIPPDAIRMAKSKGCANQAFEYKRRVIGLQFHLEYLNESISQLIQHCQDEIIEGRYIQGPKQMLSQQSYLKETNKTINLLLDRIEIVQQTI